MEDQSIIHAFQGILTDFSFEKPQSFPEEFAQKRYLKKMETPDESVSAIRAEQCWLNWIGHDASLPSNLELPPSRWYIARKMVHKALEHFAIDEFTLPNGSEFTPTRGRESIQQRLSHSTWDCTRSNIDLFARLCYRTPALKKAVRERFKNLVQKHGTDLKSAQRMMWSRLAGLNNQQRARIIWAFKVRSVVTFVEGSRFTTVRKDNSKDRPINIEGFCNLVTQRSIGLGLKKVIHTFFGVDLSVAQDVHAEVISLAHKATIDLKNASDSVSWALVKFLFPKWFIRLLEQTASPAVLGPDGDYHWTKKISAMGNGFTFELMTLILLAITRCSDPASLVYGDDIIVDNDVAHDVISDITSVGFIVNEAKSFVSSPFRESCGANYHDDHGYIRSFDFEYPETIGDCVALHNKAYYLSRYYASFKQLYNSLTRVIKEPALLGSWYEADDHVSCVPRVDLPPYFIRQARKGGVEVSEAVLGKAVSYLREIQSSGTLRFFWGWSFREETVSKTLKHLSSRQWAKYYMYLHAGRKSKDVKGGHGRWQRVLYVTDGTFTTRWKSLAVNIDAAG